MSTKGHGMSSQPLDFFPLGDLHIENLEQAEIFSEYLNSRSEEFVVLLGDIIHFANSFWNPSKEITIEEKIQNILKDISVWEEFLNQLEKKTIYYFGSHEGYALRIILKKFPENKPKLKTGLVHLPRTFEVLSLGTSLITGLHVPDNVFPSKSPKFSVRKEIIEKWIVKKSESLNIEKPRETFLFTHDPTDSFYKNMGYRALTDLLREIPFKTHYHAHIHSNIRNIVVNETPSINRSFIALARFKPDLLKPYSCDLESLFNRKI